MLAWMKRMLLNVCGVGCCTLFAMAAERAEVFGQSAGEDSNVDVCAEVESASKTLSSDVASREDEASLRLTRTTPDRKSTADKQETKINVMTLARADIQITHNATT